MGKKGGRGRGNSKKNRWHRLRPYTHCPKLIYQNNKPSLAYTIILTEDLFDFTFCLDWVLCSCNINLFLSYCLMNNISRRYAFKTVNLNNAFPYVVTTWYKIPTLTSSFLSRESHVSNSRLNLSTVFPPLSSNPISLQSCCSSTGGSFSSSAKRSCNGIKDQYRGTRLFKPPSCCILRYIRSVLEGTSNRAVNLLSYVKVK